MPMLHIMLGVVNKVYTSLLAHIPEIERWPRNLHLVRESYHGMMFEGNECRTLMNNLDDLETVLRECDQEHTGRPFVAVLRSFDNILSNIAQNAVNLDELKTDIASFKEQWSTSGMRLTPKAHIINNHLEDFVQSRNANNMSHFSEQAHESLHAKFYKTWLKYCVKDVANESYRKQLLRALLDFNGNYGN